MDAYVKLFLEMLSLVNFPNRADVFLAPQGNGGREGRRFTILPPFLCELKRKQLC